MKKDFFPGGTGRQCGRQAQERKQGASHSKDKYTTFSAIKCGFGNFGETKKCFGEAFGALQSTFAPDQKAHKTKPNIMKKTYLILAAMATLSLACASVAEPVKGTSASDKLTDGMVINLYEDGVVPEGATTPYPEAVIVDGDGHSTAINVQNPTLTVFLPEKPNGKAMIVCPGGAFLGLSMDVEGDLPARRLNAEGITVFVLKYRLTPLVQDNGKTPVNVMEMGLTMLQRLDEAGKRWSAAHDGQEPNVTQICSQLPGWDSAFIDADAAIALVRKMAGKWNLDRNKIGIMGFSAGGITTVYQAMNHSAQGAPNFAGAIYGGWTSDVKAPEDACPLWMCSPVNDLFQPEESWDCYRAWRDSKVPTELHTFWDCQHGFGALTTGKNVDNWMTLMIQFMKDVKFL